MNQFWIELRLYERIQFLDCELRTSYGHRVGVAFRFPEGPELLPFYENLAKGQLRTSTVLRPFPVSHFYHFTPHKFFIGVLRQTRPPPADSV